MTLRSTTPFSLETPVFELESHDVTNHDETDVYGVDHELVYKSGDPADVYSFSSGIASFRVGGALNNPEDGGIRTRFSALIHFPSIRAARIEGAFVSDVEPEFEEIELVANSLMSILAKKKIEE